MYLREIYYKDKTESNVELIDGAKHTMKFTEFVNYVTSTKYTDTQKDLLNVSILDKIPIKIVGCYINDLEFLIKKDGQTILRREDRTPRRPKKFNKFRPVFFLLENKESKKELWIVTFPSKEYVDQIAELTASYCILYYKTELKKDPDINQLSQIKVIHFSKLEKELPTWTNLTKELAQFVKKGDSVVLGHVEELNEKLLNIHKFNTVIDPTDFGTDDIYTAYILKDLKTKKRIVLIGFAHSYWGSASGLIARTVVEQGAKTIFYIAKAGNLISPEEIKQYVSPSEYYLLDRGNTYDSWRIIRADVPIWPDNFRITENIRSGIHLTVPTVIGETYNQATNYERIKPATIDNEIGHIAKEIHEHNLIHVDNDDVNFICLHFLTDFLHMEYEKRVAESGLGFSYSSISENINLKREMSRFLDFSTDILHLYVTINGLIDTSVREDKNERIYREILKRISLGIISNSITVNKKHTSSQFDKSKKFVDGGFPTEAIDFVLIDKDFKELSIVEKLELIVIKQKYGLLGEARSEWNIAMDMHNDSFSQYESIEFSTLDVKLRTQEGKFNELENDCIVLAQSAKKLKMYSKIPSIYHRACYAAYATNNIESIDNYIKLSQSISTGKNNHAYNTAEFIKHSIQSFLNPNNVDGKTFEKFVEIEKTYLDTETDPTYWQANKLKSLVAVIYTEAVLMLKYDSTRAHRLLCIAHYYTTLSGCSEYSEGFAELLILIKDQQSKNLITDLMNNYRLNKNSLFFSHFRMNEYLKIRDVLYDFGNINSSNDLDKLRTKILS